jgi:hypothetical protein
VKPSTTQSPRVIGVSFLPEKDAPVSWWGLLAEGISSGGGGTCGSGCDGGGGDAWCCRVGRGGGVRCSGEDRRASSGLPCGCRRCDDGGGAWELLCCPDSAVFWHLGVGSPTKDPSPWRSLRDLASSCSWLLRVVAAPRTLSSLWVGMERSSPPFRTRTGSFSFPLPAGAGPPWQDPPGPGSARCWLSGKVPVIRIPRLGLPPTYRTARPPSSRVGIDARTADRIA